MVYGYKSTLYLQKHSINELMRSKQKNDIICMIKMYIFCTITQSIFGVV